MLASSALKSVPCSFFYFTCVRAYDLLNSKRDLFNWTCRDISICRSSSPCAVAQHAFLCQLHKLKYILLNWKNTRIFFKFAFVIVQWNLFIKFIEVCLPENLQTQRTRACWLALKKANIFTAVDAITVSNIVIEWRVSISQRYLKMFGK